MAYSFETGKKEIRLLMEYESMTQKVLSGNAVLSAFMPERKYVYPILRPLIYSCGG
jgi:hypothetical protein